MPKRSSHAGASAAVFAALGDRTRLHLVERLAGRGPRSITQLSAGMDITRQAVTKHLHVLKHAGLACHSRRGREQLWSLDQEPMNQARLFLDRVSQQWDKALDRLKSFVEGGD